MLEDIEAHLRAKRVLRCDHAVLGRDLLMGQYGIRHLHVELPLDRTCVGEAISGTRKPYYPLRITHIASAYGFRNPGRRETRIAVWGPRRNTMRETQADLSRLQRVLDVSHERAGPHLRSVITPERRLTAADLAARLTGMKLLALATVNSRCVPIVGPVDGIFYRGEFWFGTSPSALRIRHIRQNTAVSATHLEGEELAVTVHGTAHIKGVPAELPDGFGEICREIYGDDWLEWGSEAVYCRIEPARMFTFYLAKADAG